MSEASLGDLVAHLTADISDFKEKMGEAAEHVKGSFAASLVTGELIAEGIEKIADGFVDLAKEAFNHLQDVQKVAAQTAAVLKSTGEGAGIGAEGVKELAENLAHVSGVAPEVIQANENMLLTFRNIKNGVGAGNDVFNQATKTVLDMSTALGEDGKSAAIQLGKALGDPIKGVTALQRVGVTFNDTQKAQIKSFVDAGNVMGAQKMILKELNTEFGGSAEAYGSTLPGAIGRFKNAWDEVTESLGGGAIPMIREVVNLAADGFDKMADSIKSNGLLGAMDHLTSPAVKEAFIGIGGAIAMAVIPSLIEAATAAAVAIAAWAPFIALAAAIAFAAKPIVDNWTELVQEFQVDWGQLSSGVQGFLETVHNAFSQIGGIVGQVVDYIKRTLGPVFNALPEGAKKALGMVGTSFGNLPSLMLAPVHSAIASVGSAMGAAAADVAAPWKGTFQGIPDIIGKIMHAAPEAIIKQVLPGMEGAGKSLADGVASGVSKEGKKAAAAAKKVADQIKAVFTSIPKQMQAIDLKASLGDLSPLDAAKAKVQALAGDLQTLVKDGVKPTDERFQALEKSLTAAKESLSKTQQAADYAKTMATLASATNDAQLQAQAFGASFDATTPKLDATKAAITSLLHEGFAPTSPQVQKLVSQLGDLNTKSEASKKALDITNTLKGVTDGLAGINTKAAILGTSYDATTAKTDLYKNALESLAKDGVAPTDARVLHLKQALDSVNPPPPALLTFFNSAKTKVSDAIVPMQNLQDTIGKLGDDIGVKLNIPFGDTITKAGDAAAKFTDLGSNAMTLLPQIEGIGKSVIALAVQSFPMLAGFVVNAAIPAILSFGTTLQGALGPISLVAGGIAVLITVGELVKEHWAQIAAFLTPLWNGIAGVAKTVFGAIGAFFATVHNAIAGVVTTTWGGIVGFLMPIWNTISGFASKVFSPFITAAQAISAPIKAVFDGLVAIIKAPLNLAIGILNTFIRGLDQIKIPSGIPGVGGLGVNIPEIPYLATGGIATGPTVAMFGEAGPEAVVPLTPQGVGSFLGGMQLQPAMAGGGRGGGNTIILNYQGSGDKRDAEEMLDQVMRVLRLHGVTLGR